MEEVVGSIPTRSTNISFAAIYLPAPARRFLIFEGCGGVLNSSHIRRQHQFHDFTARFALLLVHRAGVNIKCRATARMAQQLLCDLDIDAERSQIRGQ